MIEKPIQYEINSAQDRTYLVRLLSIAEREYAKCELHERIIEVDYLRKKLSKSNPPYIVFLRNDEAILLYRILMDAANTSALKNYEDFDSTKYTTLALHFMYRITKALKNATPDNTEGEQ